MDPMAQVPQTNPYDFINNPQKPPKQPLFSGMKQRILAIVGILIILAVVGGIVMTILGNRSKGPQQNLKTVVAYQQEIIRVANDAESDLTSSELRGYISTVKLSVATDQSLMLERMGAIGIKMTPAEKNSKKNEKVDEAIETARAANRYDEAVKEMIDGYLEDYIGAIQTAFDTFDGAKTRADLETCYDNAKILLGLDIESEAPPAT